MSILPQSQVENILDNSRKFNGFYQKNGFLLVRPVLYVDSNNQVSLDALLNSKKFNNLPLGSVVKSDKSIGFIKNLQWNWKNILEALTLRQLVGLYCVYLYTHNCAYNSGRKVYPAEKNGKTVSKWMHHSILNNQFLPCEENNFAFTEEDVQVIGNAVASACSFEIAQKATVEPMTGSEYFMKLKDCPNGFLSRLVSTDVSKLYEERKASITDWVCLSRFYSLCMDKSMIALPSYEKFEETCEKLFNKFFSSKEEIGKHILMQMPTSRQSDFYILASRYLGFERIFEHVQTLYEGWWQSVDEDKRYFMSSPEYESNYRYYQGIFLDLLNEFEPTCFRTYLKNYEALKRNNPEQPEIAEKYRESYNSILNKEVEMLTAQLHEES